ncbi:MAG: shikimate dehydrogenase [Casimicrobiaceae bacterium]
MPPASADSVDGLLPLDGTTRLIAIIGDPIAQVKSPGGVTRALQAKGRNAIVVPVHVPAADVDTFLRAAALVRNLDGIIATVPHKFAAYAHCATATSRADLLQAANTLRRNDDGSWHGDHLDGEGFVAAMRHAGCEPHRQRALLAGAGGAGSAIGLALLDAGVAALGIHDDDPVRRDALVGRLSTCYPDRVAVAVADPTGYAVVVNATPAGMRDGDPYPVRADKLSQAMFVGDVITVPAVTPLLATARKLGCRSATGIDMFAAVCALMVEFLLDRPATGAMTAPPAAKVH